jgi:hypothetical protein
VLELRPVSLSARLHHAQLTERKPATASTRHAPFLNLFPLTRPPTVAGFHFKESDLMNTPDSYDTNIDDEPDVVQDNEAQEENETKRIGARFVKEKHGSTIDQTTASANSLDADLLPAPDSEQEEIEVRRGKKAEDDDEAEPELPRAVAPKTAKQQVKEKLADALADFGKLPKPPKEPANDNFRPTVSWPLMDQLTRSTFEPDKERRTKLIVTARYIRDLIDMAGADALGNESDCEMQRAESSEVFFEHGQTLDRKRVIFDTKDGESDAERYSGSVRTAKKSGPVSNSGFDSNRDDPFPVRVMAAREELAVIIAAVGPLWLSLFRTVSENATLTDIGLAIGAKSFQAPHVGTLFIRLALSAG